MRILKMVLFTLAIISSSQSHAGLFGFGEGDDYAKTKYPIVLIHGGMGFDFTKILGFIPTDYWPNIPSELTRGGATVYVLQASTFHDTGVRGEQIIREIETIKALTGHEKFNIIGHSFGAPTTRYVAGSRPDLIASATTIGGTNDIEFVKPVLDTARGISIFGCDFDCAVSLLRAPINLVVNGVASLAGIPSTQEECTRDVFSSNEALREQALISCEAINKEIEANGMEIDTYASLQWFLSDFEDFKEQFPWGIPENHCEEGIELESNGVRYFSWSGAKPGTNLLDVSDIVMVLGGFGLSLLTGGGRSDGLVWTCDSHLGNVIRDDYPMNHLDETNLLWGLTRPFFSETGLFRQHANRLKNKGL